MVSMDDMPQSESELALAFSNLRKLINNLKNHLHEAEDDLSAFEKGVEVCEAQLEALDVELGQRASETGDDTGKLIYRQLMSAEQVVQREIEGIRADRTIADDLRTIIEESLQELLDHQTTLLAFFKGDSRH